MHLSNITSSGGAFLHTTKQMQMESTALGLLFLDHEIICNSVYAERPASDGDGRRWGMRGSSDCWITGDILGGSCFHSSQGTEIKFRHFSPVAAEKMHDYASRWSSLASPAHKPWEIKLETNIRPFDFQREWWCVGKLAFTVLLI